MRLFAAIATSLALTIATPAVAADAPASSGGGLKLDHGLVSAYGIIAYHWWDTAYGLGFRYQVPLLPEGLLKNPNVKDDLAIDAGLDFVHLSYGNVVTGYNPSTFALTYSDLSWNALIPTVGVLWNFWLTPQLAVYPKLNLGFVIGWWSADWANGYGPSSSSSFFLEGAVGAQYKMDKLSLRAEAGSGMLKLGVAFQL
jgi:hypothetical protein